MKPSIFAQLEATAISPQSLLRSPRHWNCGLLRYQDRLWMTYRFHRMDAGGRCGTAIVELGEDLKPIGKSQHLKFRESSGNEHFEDARMFMLRGEPHIGYTMMHGYRPGVDYSCAMKYAQLKFAKGRWSVVAEYQPHYGQNDGIGKEKNWMFFDCDDELYCVYAGSPEHVVLKIEGEKIVEEFRSQGPLWHWGVVRGGTPPVRCGDHYVAIFHSSLPTETAPHYVRYYGAAYTFEAKAPFRVLQISEVPLMSGSEQDGHRVDPRYVEGWKPFVVFPCGLVPGANSWLVSIGVNDWQCAVARIPAGQLKLGAPDGSSYKAQCFRIENGSIPVQFADQVGSQQFLHWEMFVAGRNGRAAAGYLKSTSAREAAEIMEIPGVEQIPETTYDSLKRMAPRR